MLAGMGQVQLGLPQPISPCCQQHCGLLHGVPTSSCLAVTQTTRATSCIAIQHNLIYTMTSNTISITFTVRRLLKPSGTATSGIKYRVARTVFHSLALWAMGVQVLPGAAQREPFLIVPESVEACGVALGQLVPSLLSRLQVDWHMPHLASLAALQGATVREFRWALQVGLILPADRCLVPTLNAVAPAKCCS